MLSYNLSDLYSVIGISEQAVSQHRKRRGRASLEVVSLLQDMDDYRSRHPGYQLSKYRSGVKTTIPGHYTWPNLIEGMVVAEINRVWQSDITYFRIGEHHSYITFIIDVYSRRIVGYAVSNTLESKANIMALSNAIKLRKNDDISKLIHHSDRGSQYTSKAYLALLLSHGCLPSMGSKGQDNAYAERLNGVIKNEYLVYRQILTLRDLKSKVKQAVQQYNTERIHTSLPGKISPNAFEKEILTLNYQRRPKVIIYAEGKDTTRHANTMLCSLPKKALQAHICPI